MNILAIDESIKVALSKSRKVLGAFLERKGSRTYSGRLGAQGVEALAANLSKIASKNTAIALFHIASNGETTLIKRIGRKNAWDDQGQFAFKSRTMQKFQKTITASTDHVWKYLRCITRLAALFHDIGKANVQFQNKIRGSSPSGERIRHELLSYLLLDAWAQRVSSAPIQPGHGAKDSWLETLANDPSLPLGLSSLRAVDGQANIDKRWNDIKFPDDDAYTLASSCIDRIAQAQNVADLALSSILWLVLTHHKPIGVDSPNRDGQPKRSDPQFIVPKLSQSNPQLPFESQNTQIVADGLPWHDASWSEAVRDNAKTLSELINEPKLFFALFPPSPPSPPSDPTSTDASSIQRGQELYEPKNNKAKTSYVLNLSAMARPILILSDYVASAQKVHAPYASAILSLNSAYANSTTSNGQNFLADSLSTHLLKARRAIDPFYSMADQRFDALPVLESSNYPALALRSDPNGRFAWQNNACDAISTLGAETSNAPFFGIVIAETGAGKTIAGAKIIATASGENLRYTCALGLRSLTLQTGAAYRSNLGLGNNVSATMIGDMLYAKANDQTDPNAAQGSESLGVASDFEFDSADETTSRPLARALKINPHIDDLVFDSKARRLIETPVLVCTVDHLMQAATLQRGSDAFPLLRIMSADIVLDEIDNYSIEDLKALCRLVHIAGLYRRKVLIMSATVSSTVAQALHKAWMQGLAAADMRLGLNASDKAHSARLLLVHNRIAPEISTSNDKISASERIDAYFMNAAKMLSGSQHNNTAKSLDVSGKTIVEKFDAIHGEILDMSGKHYVGINSSNRKINVSTGFARFNKVQQARQFAKYLHQKHFPKNILVKVLCYHSRIPMLMLSTIESGLNQLLSRKDNESEESARLAANPNLALWLDEIKDKPEIDTILCIVSTTSIQETGRDHDYDFGIAEPRSTRSSVQMPGRIRRHRKTIRPTVPNFCILSEEFADKKQSNASRVGMEISNFPAIKSLWSRASNLSQTTPAFSELINESSAAAFAPKWQKYHQRHAVINSAQTLAQTDSLLFGIFPPAATPDVFDRTTWFNHSFFQLSNGISAAPCLHPIGAADAALPSIEHLYFKYEFALHLAERIQTYGSYPVACITSPASNPYQHNFEWLWGRHDFFVRFRRADGYHRQYAFWPPIGINPKIKEVGIVELFTSPKGVVAIQTPICFENAQSNGDSLFTCVANLDRCMFPSLVAELILPLQPNESRSDSALKFGIQSSTLIANLGITPPSLNPPRNLLTFGFALQSHGDAVPDLYFDVILGADTSSSDY